jgi:hypothetical protein
LLADRGRASALAVPAWAARHRSGWSNAAVARAVTRDPDPWVLDIEPVEPGFPLGEPVLDTMPEPDPARAAAEALFRPKRP